MEVKEMLEMHIKEEETKLQHIEDVVMNLRDNHLFHVKLDIVDIKTDLRWVKWLVMGIAGAILTIAVASLR
jgi:hypothetical protein